jgi:hypothetical protein
MLMGVFYHLLPFTTFFFSSLLLEHTNLLRNSFYLPQ